MCSPGYFLEYGLCSPCPAVAKGTALVESFTVPLAVAALFGLLFVVRSLAPRGLMKVGISMLQVVASANSVYSIPWPKGEWNCQHRPVFSTDLASIAVDLQVALRLFLFFWQPDFGTVLDGMRVFLVGRWP